jgi:hypothetical protein
VLVDSWVEGDWAAAGTDVAYVYTSIQHQPLVILLCLEGLVITLLAQAPAWCWLVQQ